MLVAGATLLTEAVPEPGPHPRLPRTRAGHPVPGWPDQAARLAAHPRLRRRRPVVALRPRQPPGRAPPGSDGRPGARANLFGMTESFGPVLRLPARHRLPPAKRGSCGRPFAGIEVRIIRPGVGPRGCLRAKSVRSGSGAEPDARHLRTPPVVAFRRATASTAPATSGASTRTATSSTTVGWTTCSRSTGPRSTRPRSSRLSGRSKGCARPT